MTWPSGEASSRSPRQGWRAPSTSRASRPAVTAARRCSPGYLGVARIVLPRHLTLPEIEDILVPRGRLRSVPFPRRWVRSRGGAVRHHARARHVLPRGRGAHAGVGGFRRDLPRRRPRALRALEGSCLGCLLRRSAREPAHRQGVHRRASGVSFRSVPLVGMALVGLAAGDLLLGACARFIHARLSAGERRVRPEGRAVRSCLTSPILADSEGFRHADLLTRRFRCPSYLRCSSSAGLLGAAQHAIFLAIAAAISTKLSLPLALWSFAGVSLSSIATAAFRGAVDSKARDVPGAMADLSHFLSERLSVLRPIRFHLIEDEERERLATENQRLSRSGGPLPAAGSAVTWRARAPPDLGARLDLRHRRPAPRVGTD